MIVLVATLLGRRDSTGVWNLDKIDCVVTADATDVLFIETAMIEGDRIRTWENDHPWWMTRKPRALLACQNYLSPPGICFRGALCWVANCLGAHFRFSAVRSTGQREHQRLAATVNLECAAGRQLGCYREQS